MRGTVFPTRRRASPRSRAAKPPFRMRKANRHRRRSPPFPPFTIECARHAARTCLHSATCGTRPGITRRCRRIKQCCNEPTPPTAGSLGYHGGSGDGQTIKRASAHHTPSCAQRPHRRTCHRACRRAVRGFGIWNWVSGSLRKEDWLTGKAAGPATTWLILGSDERDGTTGSDDTPETAPTRSSSSPSRSTAPARSFRCPAIRLCRWMTPCSRSTP